MQIVALRYYESEVLESQVFRRLDDAVSVIGPKNASNLRVGYAPEWSLYLIDGRAGTYIPLDENLVDELTPELSNALTPTAPSLTGRW